MNKGRLFLTSLAFSLCLSGSAWAQKVDAAPSMFNVQEILVQFARIGNSKAANLCSIGREDILDNMMRSLKLDSMPAVAVNVAKAQSPNIARIDLVPEVVTLASPSGDCTSWVGLAAQSTSVARILPVETSRNITISYWRNGQLISSSQTSHGRLVTELLQKLTREFSKQYQVDQPPPLPNFDIDTAPQRTP